MGFTTHLELHSQATRLQGDVNLHDATPHGPITLYGKGPRSNGLGRHADARKWRSQTPHSDASGDARFGAGL